MRKQLSQGKDGEDRVYSILYKAGYDPEFVCKAERSFFDIKCKDFTVEIKNDLRAISSGNVAFEVFNPLSGKNAGLSITKANLWIHIIGDEICMTSVKRLS